MKNKVLYEVGQRIKDEKRDLTITQILRIKDKSNGRKVIAYKYECNVCGFDCGKHYNRKTNEWRDDYTIVQSSLKNGNGCNCCKGHIVVPEINSIYAVAPFMMKLGVSEEDAKKHRPQSQNKIIVKCPDCGEKKEIKVQDIFKNNSIGCTCGDGFSRGHKYIHNMLNQLNIDFKGNYIPDWCRYYNKYKKIDTYGEYDFFIEDMKLIIEVDGGFHRIDNNMSGQTKEESKYIDDMKDRLAEENGYRVIRVLYDDIFDFEENILNSEIAVLFNLDDVDWLLCKEYSSNKLTRIICDYWSKKRTNETTTEVAKIFSTNRVTVRRYLKLGTELGWCNYDGDEEFKKVKVKSSKRSAEVNGKMVEVFKDGISLGVFDNCHSLYNKSEELFGVKLHFTKISAVAIGKRKSHKGFTFRYLDNEGGYEAMMENYNKPHKGKKIEIFKDGVPLGVFDSSRDLARKSEDLFGVKLNDTNITMVANGKRNHHKGFTFKFVKDSEVA